MPADGLPPPPPVWPPPGSYSVAAPLPPKTTTKAIWAGVLGFMSLVTSCTFVTGIPAVIVGRRALKEIDASDGALGGRAVALAGLIAGAIGTALFVAFAALFAVLFFFTSAFELEDPAEVTADELAARSEWVDACDALQLGGESSRCECAFDLVVTQLDTSDVERMARTVRRGYVLTVDQRVAFVDAMDRCR